jgi:hypothetical protein
MQVSRVRRTVTPTSRTGAIRHAPAPAHLIAADHSRGTMQRAALLGLECAFDLALVAPELPPFPCPPGLALWFHNALSNGFSQPNGHVRGRRGESNPSAGRLQVL